MMLERQSTTVPNTSKQSALTEDGSMRAISRARGASAARAAPLEGGGGLEHGEVGEAAADDLEADGQPALVKPAGSEQAGWPVKLKG